MGYAEALRYLYSFIDWERGIGYGVDSPPRFTLDRISALLRALDNPHQRFASVHIAGSKGKGSTAAILESVLRAAGLRTGLYTQPHLHTFRERVRIDNRPVGPETFARLVERIAGAVETLASLHPSLGKPTTYELATALGFLCFAEEEVDLAVVEVGLGGRLDATNVITPLVSVITSISLEHTAILGNSLTAIAKEKAGIVKQDGVLVQAPNPADVLDVFSEICKLRGARIIAADDSLCAAITMPDPHENTAGIFSSGNSTSMEGKSVHTSTGSPPTGCEDSRERSTVAKPTGEPISFAVPVQHCRAAIQGEQRQVRFPLLGRHQRVNLSVALAVVDELAARGMPLAVDAVCAGVEAVRWPGRFEQLSTRPLVVADGAHTPDSIACLRETLAEHYSGRSVHCILGMNQDKDADLLLEAILPAIDNLIVCRSRHPRAQEPQRIAAAVAGRAPTALAESVSQAIEMGMAAMGSEDVLCVTGSLFVVAEAREAFGLAEELDPPIDLSGVNQP